MLMFSVKDLPILINNLKIKQCDLLRKKERINHGLFYLGLLGKNAEFHTSIQRLLEEQNMHRIWRWRLFIISWIGGVYLCVLGFISVVKFREPEMTVRDNGSPIAVHSSIPRKSPWELSVKRGGGRIEKFPWCKPLHWRIPAGPNTALVSFPGSGNTWLRYLLQQATGVLTGSVYKDYALLKNGFPAESVSNGSVLVVKTHEWGIKMRNNFKRAILMIRDPFESILAEFNRQSGGHIGHASTEKFRRDQGNYWNSFAKTKAVGWLNTTLDWLEFKGPLLIVYYENLVNNIEQEIKKILDFLELPLQEEELSCMMKHKDGIYRRKKRPLAFDPFTPSLKTLVYKCKDIADNAIAKYVEKHTPQLQTAVKSISFIDKDKKS